MSADNPLGLDITDPAARDDVWTQNQLNLSVGGPVIVHLSSKDVVHSFGLPQMRVKEDGRRANCGRKKKAGHLVRVPRYGGST